VEVFLLCRTEPFFVSLSSLLLFWTISRKNNQKTLQWNFSKISLGLKNRFFFQEVCFAHVAQTWFELKTLFDFW
jgi:hypothetical protein